MGLNTINFASLPIQQPDYSGYENIFSNILKGYQTARAPIQMRQEEQAREFNNTILGENARIAPKSADANLAKILLDNEHRGLENKYYEPQARAQIAASEAQTALHAAQARNGGRMGGTPLAIEKAYDALDQEVALNGPDSEKAQALRGVISRLSTPTGDIPTSTLRTQKERSKTGSAAREIILNENTMPLEFQEPGGAITAGKYIWDYNHTKDPKVKEKLAKKLVDASVSLRLLPEAAGYQLQALSLRDTKANLDANEDVISANWGTGLKLALKGLPAELAKLSDQKHAEAVKKLRQAQIDASSYGAPSGSKTKGNPEAQKQVLQESLQQNSQTGLTLPKNELFIGFDRDGNGYTQEDMQQTMQENGWTEQQFLQAVGG